MAANALQTPEEITKQILKAKTEDPGNYKRIQRLQQLLDKLMENKYGK
jgi:hypothetical protein